MTSGHFTLRAVICWTVHIPVVNVGVTVGVARVPNLEAAIQVASDELDSREAGAREQAREDGAGGVWRPGC